MYDIYIYIIYTYSYINIDSLNPYRMCLLFIYMLISWKKSTDEVKLTTKVITKSLLSGFSKIYVNIRV